jgi:hypothetical protein
LVDPLKLLSNSGAFESRKQNNVYSSCPTFGFEVIFPQAVINKEIRS